ncbi:hypothetical protein GCM10027090_07120 [Sinomonas soli]
MGHPTLLTSIVNHYLSFMHDKTVKYEQELLGRVEDGFDLKRVPARETPRGETQVNESDFIFIASGHCPTCHAPGQQGTGRENVIFTGLAPPWIDVVIDCSCGFGHGGEGEKTGCGRTWSVGAFFDEWKLTDE